MLMKKLTNFTISEQEMIREAHQENIKPLVYAYLNCGRHYQLRAFIGDNDTEDEFKTIEHLDRLEYFLAGSIETELGGTGLFEFVKTGQSGKHSLTKNKPYPISSEALTELRGAQATFETKRFPLNRIENIEFYIETKRLVKLKRKGLFVYENQFISLVRHTLKNLISLLTSKVAVIEIGVKICDGIDDMPHPVIYAVLTYLMKNRTLPIQNPENIEILWAYIEGKYDKCGEDSSVAFVDSIIKKSQLWTLYTDTYSRKILNHK
jgi:hypothetical protein